MNGPAWGVFVTEPARRDLRNILDETLTMFGRDQANRYGLLINAALFDLEDGPDHPLIRRRDDLPDGIFLMPVRRRGASARHYLACRTAKGRRIDILRILHDAMDLPSHLTGLHEDAATFEAGL
ncbi:MAG: hypothetical protein JWP35_3205 [Caulobacter sp.]|nr:hypothetical protein [Caulobacter sp.]